MSNIEIINGIEIDWSKFKGDTVSRNASRAKKSYVDLCELIHNNRHTLESDYIGNEYKILINFNCGHPSHLIAPREYKSGKRCPLCFEDRRGKSRSNKSKEKFVKLVESNGHKLLSEYTHNRIEVIIDFNCGHKPSLITPHKYKCGRRCIECNKSKNAIIRKNRAEDELINAVISNDHKLLSEYINSSTKVLIDFNCGHPSHWILPNDYRYGVGCPYCKNKGEGALQNLLIDMGLEVETQKTFTGLKDEYKLRYDFYLPKYNLLIELDGEHHRDIIRYSDDEYVNIKRLKDAQYRDKLKNDYAKNNNIPLLRIEYFCKKRELDKWRTLIENKIKEIEFNK